MAELFQIFNGPMPTVAKRAAVGTTTSILTLLQAKLANLALRGRVVEWGVSGDGSVAATPISFELITTDVAATVTAHVASGIQNVDPLGIVPSDGKPFSLSTTTTGYTANVEGTIVTTRTLDAQLIAPTNQFIHQWPLGREVIFHPDTYLRIRVHAGTAINAICYFIIEV